MIDSPQAAASGAIATERAEQAAPQNDAVRLRLFGLAVGPLWVYAIYYLGSLWFANADYSYGWLMPLLCGALFYERWQRRPPAAGPEAHTGPLLLGIALAVAIAMAALLVQLVPGWRSAAWAMGFSLVLSSVAGLHLAGGQPWVRHFAFPLAFFLIAIPWPGRFEIPLIDGLSRLNATISAVVANFLGSPAIREGITIRVGAGLVGVDEACSGIRSFQASVMVALFLGELFRFGLARRLIFLVCGVCIAMLCNVVRTTYLVRICDLRGLDALNVNHDAAGFVILGVTMTALLGLAWAFIRLAPGARRGAENVSAEGGVGTGEETLGEDASWDALRVRSVAPAQRALYAVGASAVVVFAVAELSAAWWFGPSEKQGSAATTWSVNEKWLASQPGFTNQVIEQKVASILRYDTGKHFLWNDSHARPWQMFYLGWNAAGTHYTAALSSTHAQGHAAELCLSYIGVPQVSTDGAKLMEKHEAKFVGEVQRFNYHGKAMHTLSLYSEIPSTGLRVTSTDTPGFRSGVNRAREAWVSRTRGRAEKRVIKLAVWGIEDDAEARQNFEELLKQMIVP